MTLVALKLSGYSNLTIGKNTTVESFDEQLEEIREAVGILMDLIMFMLEERILKLCSRKMEGVLDSPGSDSRELDSCPNRAFSLWTY